MPKKRVSTSAKKRTSTSSEPSNPRGEATAMPPELAAAIQDILQRIEALPARTEEQRLAALDALAQRLIGDPDHAKLNGSTTSPIWWQAFHPSLEGNLNRLDALSALAQRIARAAEREPGSLVGSAMRVLSDLHYELGESSQRRKHGRRACPTVYERILAERRKDPDAKVATIARRAGTTERGYYLAMRRKITSRSI